MRIPFVFLIFQVSIEGAKNDKITFFSTLFYSMEEANIWIRLFAT